MSLSGKRVGPIGIDIGARCIRAMQFRGSGSRIELAAAVSVDLDVTTASDAEQLSARLREAVGRGGFAGRCATACVPSSSLEVKTIRLPKMPAEELDAAAVLEARERFANLGDDWTVRAMPAGAVGRDASAQQEVIILASPTAAIEARLRLLTDAGLTVAGLEPPGHAFFRPFERFLGETSDGDQAHAFLDFGRSCSQVIIARGRDIVFLKNCPIGGTSLDEVVADKLSIPLSEATACRRDALAGRGVVGKQLESIVEAVRPVLDQLGREIGLCMRYYAVTFRGARPESVTCGGSESASSRLLEMLSESAHLPCRVGHALRGVECGTVFSADQIESGLSEWTTAVGLALRPSLACKRKAVAA